jgi:hypothetical protein
MESQEILSQAAGIVRAALARAERADLEKSVCEFEKSEVPVLRSLARTYRMLQRPFF